MTAKSGTTVVDPLAKPDPVDSAVEAERRLIHFLEDGFTALGEVWYRGQEIEFEIGSKAYQDTCDVNGDSWLNLTELEQAQKWGKIMFRVGPWPGETYEDAEALAKEQVRSRKPPTLPSVVR